jgi:uncharacterized ferredoxin-like protein
MSNLTDCPVCGHKNCLEFSQNADIVYEFDGTKLMPRLNEDSIGWMDHTSLYCSNCMANDEDNARLHYIKKEFEKYL